MLNQYKTKREEGFTIIEVLIVLAIAGLIILIVFLAVPALQRNSRNTQRKNDASLLASAVSECLNNKNGQVDKCNDYATEIKDTFIDETKLRQLTNISNANIVPLAGELTNANISFGYKCNTAGDNIEAGTTRQFAVSYRVEIASGNDGIAQCVDA